MMTNRSSHNNAQAPRQPVVMRGPVVVVMGQSDTRTTNIVRGVGSDVENSTDSGTVPEGHAVVPVLCVTEGTILLRGLQFGGVNTIKEMDIGSKGNIRRFRGALWNQP